MYAVSCKGVGLISGTLAYSRRDAIGHFMEGYATTEWEKFKHAGYRTVEAMVEVKWPDGHRWYGRHS